MTSTSPCLGMWNNPSSASSTSDRENPNINRTPMCPPSMKRNSNSPNTKTNPPSSIRPEKNRPRGMWHPPLLLPSGGLHHAIRPRIHCHPTISTHRKHHEENQPTVGLCSNPSGRRRYLPRKRHSPCRTQQHLLSLQNQSRNPIREEFLPVQG